MARPPTPDAQASGIRHQALSEASPIEGYALAFNGDKGRLEIRDFERLIKSFGQRTKVEIPRAEVRVPKVATAAVTTCCVTRFSEGRRSPTT